MSARTDTAHLRVVRADEALTTVEQQFPWTLPPVTARYERPSRWTRIHRSPFARDVTSRLGGALQAVGLFGLAFFAVVGLAWLGVTVPTAAAVTVAFIGGAVTWDTVIGWLGRSIDTATTLPDPRKETSR